MSRTLFLSLFLFFITSPLAAQTTLPVDVRATHLRVDTSDNANIPVPIVLATLGLAPGDTIRLESVGDWHPGPYGDIITTMMAVFSGSATLLNPSQQFRVVNAIDAGIDLTTCCSWPNNQALDIPEDFGFDHLGIEIMIPTGATHLFVAVRDNYIQDNSDPDGDCAVRITLVSQSGVPEDRPHSRLASYPNPFRTESTIAFQLEEAAEIRIDIHDVAGRFIRTLLHESVTSGIHRVKWDGLDNSGIRVAPGTYFARIVGGVRPETVRLILVR